MPVDPAPTARRTRQRLSAPERRDALIRATVVVVAERGHARASLAEIAATAGMSKGLIWHYFTDGDDLMVQTARATLVRLRQDVTQRLDLTAPVPTIIRAAITAAAQLPRTHPQELAAVDAIVNNLRGPEGTPRLGPAEYEETYTLQEALFARGQQEGSLRPLNPRLSAVTYQGAIDTMIIYLRAHPGADADEYARSLADLLLDGMTPR